MYQPYTKKIEKISQVFDVDKVLELETDKEYVQKYYKINKIPYSIFHTTTDLIYMGISRDGVCKEDDLLEAARTVEKYLIKLKGKKVLELATGRGATSFHLAKKFPLANFYGIDISKGQLDFAFKKSRRVKNYRPEFGDYHDLGRYEDKKFDVVFVIEALCYSLDKGAVLKEVYRVLKPGGVFIVFDGYIKKSRALMPLGEKKALKLAEKGMALEEFETFDSFLGHAAVAGFEIDYQEDVSRFTLPTMRRFERVAYHFFRLPRLTKLFSKFFPKEFLFNMISATLLPVLVEEDVCSYMIAVLKK